VNFLNLDLPHLRAYVENLIDRMGAHRYILANSDNCPPVIALEKFILVSEMVRSRSYKNKEI
jgi:hypothetical protein